MSLLCKCMNSSCPNDHIDGKRNTQPSHPCPPPSPVTYDFFRTNSQPAPVANDLPAVWGMVMKDMVDRDQQGRKRYGVPLQPHNGRDALRDAYEEALDLVVYLRQAIYEREAATVKVPGWCKWEIEDTK